MAMQGYAGNTHRILKAASVKVGDRVRVESFDRIYEGVLMPRTELGDPNHLVLKVASGYNVGVRVVGGTKLSLLEHRELPALSMPKLELRKDPGKPNVTIVGVGGRSPAGSTTAQAPYTLRSRPRTYTAPSRRSLRSQT